MATITKRKWTNKSGAHEAWVLAYTDAAGTRHKRQFATRREADATRVAAEGKIATGQFRADADKFTVRKACDGYLEHLEARHDRDARVTSTYLATVRSELSYACPDMVTDEMAAKRNRATPFSDGIGAVKLSKLTSRTIAELSERMLAAGISVSATRRTLASLARALDHARTRDMIATNPARGVRVVGRRDEGPKKIAPPTKSAMLALKDKAEPGVWLRLQFAGSTGLRASEQWALRWRHLDLDAPTPVVRVETRVDRHGQFDTTKSAAGRRDVPLGAALVSALKAWRLATEFGSDDDLVFPAIVRRKAGNRAVTQNHKNFYDRIFLPLLSSAEISEEFNWHSLRHFAVSSWIDAGLQPKTVQTYAGHATLAITMDRYGHLFPSESHKAAMDRVADALA